MQLGGHAVGQVAPELVELMATEPDAFVRETLTWAALGKSSRDTAEILQITERPATAHTVNAMQKLGAANKTQAVVKAMQAKFIRI